MKDEWKFRVRERRGDWLPITGSDTFCDTGQNEGRIGEQGVTESLGAMPWRNQRKRKMLLNLNQLEFMKVNIKSNLSFLTSEPVVRGEITQAVIVRLSQACCPGLLVPRNFVLMNPGDFLPVLPSPQRFVPSRSLDGTSHFMKMWSPLEAHGCCTLQRLHCAQSQGALSRGVALETQPRSTCTSFLQRAESYTRGPGWLPPQNLFLKVLLQ